MNSRRAAALMCVLCLAMAGCGGAASVSAEQLPIDDSPQASSVTQETPKYSAPPMKLAQFHADAAMGGGGVLVDVSEANRGYVGASGQSNSRLKLQVVYGESKYNYNMPSDGTPLIVPLQSGDGSYKLRIMQNTVDDKYIELYSTTVDVALESEFEPFLYSSTVVSFDENSDSTTLAAQLCQDAASEADVVAAIYDYLRDNIAYDYDFAASNPPEYYASPDDTLSSGKGICVDYAATAAAMLRSQGIPTKVITGYVGAYDLYHAWNMFYTQESGWVTAEIAAPNHDWQRIDITFAATGTSVFTGDGTDYTDRYVY